ncbi:CopD family protein [Pseudotenacibaculum sp. MALMAid0570]|uniref:CopD family protein n=1 Tax=Pseudotenacibaculum sp. MALMAid0570 TaxID=3143938 RepID=UPI0032DFE875
MELLYAKSLHIIFVITWFAGLFYMVRLFIYHTEAEQKNEPAKSILQNQYKLMSKRLWYIITWPSAILASLSALWMLILQPGYLTEVWMHVKLSFVFALYFYHAACHKIFNQLQNDEVKYSSFKLRMWNEVATLLLFAIVFTVVLKNAISWIWGVIGILLFGILLMLSIKLYKKIREKKDWDNKANENSEENDED